MYGVLTIIIHKGHNRLYYGGKYYFITGSMVAVAQSVGAAGVGLAGKAVGAAAGAAVGSMICNNDDDKC